MICNVLGTHLTCRSRIPSPFSTRTRRDHSSPLRLVFCYLSQGCGFGRFFRIPTPDSDSSSFKKPTPTPVVLKTRLQQLKKRLRLPTPAENIRLHRLRLHRLRLHNPDLRNLFVSATSSVIDKIIYKCPQCS